ncbi:hypothetical protein PENPOL_c002G03309 [Penicillium polonicum]|uniref:Reverse transcriptase Ty1/copia-type domain-containing protein n=1 Tax=Penicillium polonicum TaxID=60169 RepID=A0A1V6NWM6_PENPO|nr:hypothetical protein PENPOL_c002G03309 [Penicillium polonicum]
MEIKEFQTKIGTLIWLMVSTRPDILFVVIKLAKHAKNPDSMHFQALKRVFGYLAGTKHLAFAFRSSNDDNQHLTGYCDADWAGPHSEKGLSTSGFVFMMAGGPISWTSKKQSCVALSTTESEYIAEALATQEAIWLRQLLTEIGIDGSLKKPINIYYGTTDATTDGYSPRTRSGPSY